MNVFIPLLLLLITSMPVMAAIDPDKPTLFITGSNRGIGLEFVSQYSARGWNVIATTRNVSSSQELNELALERPNIIVEQLDVTDTARLLALAKQYEES